MSHCLLFKTTASNKPNTYTNTKWASSVSKRLEAEWNLVSNSVPCLILDRRCWWIINSTHLGKAALKNPGLSTLHSCHNRYVPFRGERCARPDGHKDGVLLLKPQVKKKQLIWPCHRILINSFHFIKQHQKLHFPSNLFRENVPYWCYKEAYGKV